jgi:hypothetical protein
MNEGTPRGLLAVYIGAICVIAMVIAAGSITLRQVRDLNGTSAAKQNMERKHGE